MESSSSRRHHPYASSIYHEKFRTNQIDPAAIIGKSCPICLSTNIETRKAAVLTACKHVYCVDCIRKWSDFKRNCPLCNAEFTSWFFDISISSRTFRTEELAGLREVRKVGAGDYSGRRRDLATEPRVMRRSREELNSSNSRTRPLPTRRSFGQSRSVPPDIIRERVLRWRTSIYEQHLQAVPCSSRDCLEQYAPGKVGVKETLMHRIQPWIRRELQAILGDPDPSIVVHVATSLFISSLKQQHKAGSRQSIVGENYLNPLRSFLFERTNTFWHELRCFAESSFNMETYDTVVEYTKRSD